jgi:hypothetical protein
MGEIMSGKNKNSHPGDTAAAGPSEQAPLNALPKENFREFVAEVDCIYRGKYAAAGTRIRADAESLPHFRRA